MREKRESPVDLRSIGAEAATQTREHEDDRDPFLCRLCAFVGFLSTTENVFAQFSISGGLIWNIENVWGLNVNDFFYSNKSIKLSV